MSFIWTEIPFHQIISLTGKSYISLCLITTSIILDEKSTQEMFVKWMIVIFSPKHAYTIFYLPLSVNQDMASILVEKFTVRIWSLGNETETKIIDPFTSINMTAFGRVLYKWALSLWHWFLLQLKNISILHKVGDSNICTAKSLDTLEHKKQCLTHLISEQKGQ